jgi:hypothetical protein
MLRTAGGYASLNFYAQVLFVLHDLLFARYVSTMHMIRRICTPIAKLSQSNANHVMRRGYALLYARECPVGQTHGLLETPHFLSLAWQSFYKYLTTDAKPPMPKFIIAASDTLSLPSSLSYCSYIRHEQGFCGIHSKASRMSRVNRVGHRGCAYRCWSRRTSAGWKQNISPVGLGGHRVLD